MVGYKFKEELILRKNKPCYIPCKEELLKYIDINYIEINKEYEEFMNFLNKLYWRKSKVAKVCRDIKYSCRTKKSFENLPLFIEEWKFLLKMKNNWVNL